MGGRAFKDLYCPRINPRVYNIVKSQVTTALQTVFAHVTVPIEMPEKRDYGDIDFLVCSPLHSPGTHTINDFPWEETVRLTKDVLATMHGRRGYLTNDCMYFAIKAPCDGDYFIQIDVKVCFKPELFEWYTFELNYASNSKIIGSMVKPLGLTIDPEGIHICVEDIEETDHHGSIVWISKNPKDVLKIAGLDYRIINASFSTKETIYQYFATSWLFHPAHFAARLAEEKYNSRLEDRSSHWMHFIKVWVPENYPGHGLLNHSSTSAESEDSSREYNFQDLQAWYKHTRAAVRDKVFTMFPDVAKEYYVKCAAHLKKHHEQRLAELIMKAIPTGTEDWKNDIALPAIIFTQPTPSTKIPESAVSHQTTPPASPSSSPTTSAHAMQDQNSPYPPSQPHLLPPNPDSPVYLAPLPREPPVPCIARPPPTAMSVQAKLACLARWTQFDPHTGTPYLRCSPRPKDADMWWMDAIDAGATEELLVRWAREAWWSVWVRQVVVNYVGMWRRRFEKKSEGGKGCGKG